MNMENTILKEIPYLGEGTGWLEMAKKNHIEVLSEAELNIEGILYDPKEYSYVSPKTGNTVWVYTRKSCGSDSEVEAGYYSNRKLTADEARYLLSKI